MLMICRNMFDIGDIYLVETSHFQLYGHTYAHDDLTIKRLIPRLENTRARDGKYIYLVSTDEQTFSVKEIYRKGDMYEI